MIFSLRKKIIITGLILACLISPGLALAPVSVQAQAGATQNNTVSTDTNTTTNTTSSSSSGDAKDLIIKIVGWVCVALVWTLGQILILLMYLLIWVASYNDFINADAVKTGWVILRDLCNMFFVLVLLVIAFATVLNRENYAMKKLLPKFIIAAILINFSKLICGVIIDFSQVIMLTFVNGFRDIGGGNLANMLGISGLLSMNPDSTGEVTVLSIVGTYLLALLYTIVATVVIGVILMILIIRMVMIWIYIVLSPMPFLLSILPATEKYASKWWDEFIKNVISGPILAFFIWLAFASVQPNATGPSLLGNTPKPNTGENETKRIDFNKDNTAPEAGISQAGSADNMLKFIISIGLLMGGLMITKELGGAGGAIAGAAASKLQSGGMKALKGMGRFAATPVRLPAKAVAERWNAFQGQRDSARKEKIQAFGERAYGRYNTAKSAIKAAPKAAARATFETAKAWTPKPVKEVVGAVADNIKYVKDTLSFKDYREARTKRRAIDNRRRAAYQDEKGVYKDAAGQEFDQVDEKTGFYYRVKKDKDGNKIEKKDAAGNVIKDAKGNTEYETEYAKEEWGGTEHHVKKMKDREYKVSGSWANSMKDAWAYSNKRKEAEVSKEQQKMSDAGLTSEQLIQTLQATASNDKQRMAAAMTLAIKEGFKNKDQIKAAEQVLGKENNSLLSKKFNDDVDKKQAYIHYDMANDLGRKQFEKRLADGKVETQQAAAYKDKNVIQAYANTFTDKEFVRKMDQVSSTSSKHDEATVTGVRDYIDTLTAPTVDPKTGKLHKARVVAPKITKNLNDVARGTGLTSADIVEAVKTYADTSSAADFAKLDVNSLTADKNIFKSSSEQDHYNKLIENIVASMSDSHFSNIVKTRDGNRQTIEKLQEIRSRVLGGGAPIPFTPPTPVTGPAVPPTAPATPPPTGGAGIPPTNP